MQHPKVVEVNKCASICTIVDVDLEDLVIPPYCGPRSMRPSLNTIAYTFFCDLFVGNFVLMWLSNPIILMGKGENDVVRNQDNENYKKVYVQWWVPMRKGVRNDEELYHNY